MRHSQTTRRTLLILRLVALLVVAATLAPRALAQAEPELVGLTVQLWPDYDRPDMLVIEQGTLSPMTPLPATITLTLPPDADLHAVARPIPNSSPALDINYTIDGNQLTLTLTQPLFLVEYYAPLITNGDERSYSYVWQQAVPVSQLSAAVQEPAAAETFSVAPEPVNVSPDFRGLNIHSLAAQAVAAGEPFPISVTYTSPTGELSAPPVAAQAPAAVDTAAAPPAQTGGFLATFNPLWLLVILGVAALVGLAFYLGRAQTAAGRPRKPAPNRPTKPPVNRPAPPPPAAKPAEPAAPAAAARFCHQCGEPLVAGDRFCRSCGTAVKTAG